MMNIKTIQIKNNQKKEYCWKYDYSKWLITDDNKAHKTIKQFLMISNDIEYYDKYLALSTSKIKGIFSFYLNLLWRVNGVRHYPDNVKLQPAYDAKLSYSVLFNKCIPVSVLDENAKTKGYQCGADLFAEKNQHDMITKRIKYELTKEYVIPFLDELQRIGLIKYKKTTKANGTESQQFLIKISNKARYSYEDNKHYNFIIIPYILLFDITKISNAGFFSFINVFNGLYMNSKKDGCCVDFKKIVKDNNIDKKVCDLLNTEYKDGYADVFASNLQQSFIDLMETCGLKQGDTIITDLSECNGKLEDINKHKHLLMCKISETLVSKFTDKYDRIYDRLFYFTQDFEEKTNINVDFAKKQVTFVYSGNDPNLIIYDTFRKNYLELEKIVKEILKCYYSTNDYSVKFFCRKK